MAETSLFLELRSIAFGCINLLSFLWMILYSVIIFWQWDTMVGSERTLVSVMLLASVFTLITLLILLLVEFRVWLDFARVSFLLIINFGTAFTFAHWRPQFQCEAQIGDQESICDMVSLGVLTVSWAVPILLIAYLVGLAIKAHRHPANSSMIDTEKALPSPRPIASNRPSLLPIMTAIPTPATPNFPSENYHYKTRRLTNTGRSINF